MAEQPTTNALAALWPSPPIFYQAFTEDNISCITELRQAQTSSTPTQSDEQDSISQTQFVKGLSGDLCFLQPPEPPPNGVYRCFGDTYNLNEALPSLEAQSIEQLYEDDSSPSNDRSLTLKRLAKSLLLNFLELITILSNNPSEHAEKSDDIRTLFINFHHLLNDYRPHQARESLIMMMEEQLRAIKAEMEGIEIMKVKVQSVLNGLANAKLKEEDGVASNQGNRTVNDLQDIWDAMERAVA